MMNLDQLENEVEALDQDTSTIFEFRKTGRDLETAGQTISDANIGRLRNIVDSFRGKLPDLPNFNRIRVDARDLADNLMLTTVAKCIARIGARNEALSKLTTELNVQIAKGNQDAQLFSKIKDGLDKANKTVTEAKTLVDLLTASDSTTKKRLKALIDSLGNVSKIFAPQDA
jgi:hypothetical protein